MRAILLSAGIGKRLRPITKKIPKCLVKVKKKPIIDIWIDDLVEKNQILIEDDFDFENGEETLENFFGQPSSNLSDFI